MNPIKLILLPDSQVRVIYDTGKEEVFKARGIPMKPWGIKATLEGRKTHTRRIRFYGNPRELLYIRENFDLVGEKIFYQSDLPDGWIRDGVYQFLAKWIPSIHMPRTAARYWLCIEDVRREYVQDITEEDAEKEGVQKQIWYWDGKNERYLGPDICDIHPNYKTGFANAWDEINANRKDKHGNRLPYSWKDNPLIYVIVSRLFFQGRGVVE